MKWKYNPFLISRLKELLDYGTYGLILDGILLDKLQFDGISYGSGQGMQQMVNISQAWRVEFVRMLFLVLGHN